MPAHPSVPVMPLPFPVPPLGGYGGASPQPSAAGHLQGGPPHGPPGFFPPAFVGQQQQPEQQRVSPHPQQSPQTQQPSPAAAGPSTTVQKRPPQQRTPPVPAKKQQTDSKPAGASDLKAAIAFVPTHLSLAKFLEANKQQGEGKGIGGTPKAPAPADLDRAFDEFLKEVGAS
ncbi:uncharacterized protein EMH_0095610 [Eimeria mitis]|uniref:Uncharacterized protein n=1 Tax=Eimeria mitis TaxID=44415 RepID=U6KAT5_9EIME|nr:uncharacterized protein EMH_0095610 [Eimeria mitis]CDJ35145.1 hypothetical protein EMH_0095610 [Eimeria mitis]